jgi:uncharacterized membrane protein YfcA
MTAVAFIAFFCEAVAGFGGTVLALALGAPLAPIPELLAILIPANMVVSLALVVRHFAAVDWRLLSTRILPAMALGLPLGMLLRSGQTLFAVVVVGLAAMELLRPRRQLPPAAAALLLGLAGAVHGAWGTGGPLVVFVTGREAGDKHGLRATLALVWLALNGLLLLSLPVSGASLRRSLAILPAALAALMAGEAVARRLPERPFRRLGAALLGAAGLLLMVRAS